MDKKNIVIVGNGGFAHEVKFLIDRINLEDPKWNFLGYIDTAEGKYVIGDDNYLLKYEQEIYAAVAIGSPLVRKKIAERYQTNKHILFPNLIDPSVLLPDETIMGMGNIICAGSIFTVNVVMGDFNIVNLSCTIGHDDIIENYVTINPGSNISGNVHIGNQADIGTGTKIIQGITISDNSVIGAGAVVISDIPKQCTAVGVPAKVIKKRT